MQQDTTHWGVWESGGVNELAEEYYFYSSNGSIYIFSTSDPNSNYQSIEVPIVSTAFELRNVARLEAPRPGRPRAASDC